jgi:hypothetical protein
VSTDPHPNVLDETATWLVGGGILTMALFPLSLPLILLTVAGLLPFLVVPLAGALVAAIVAIPILVTRHVVRRLRGIIKPDVPRVPRAPTAGPVH